MYGINSEPPKNCLDCPLCQGEYGPGNEKSYCAINPKVKLKYRGSRPKECPIIVDPLPQWQIEFLTALINKVIERKESEIIKTYTKGFDTGVETVKNERPQGDRKERTCPYCQTELLLPTYMYKGFHCPYCGEDIADMQKGGAE